MSAGRGGRGSATSTPLERRYRHWLLAYPAEYRRRRGDELVGTLLDLAGPGRTRPRPFDALDLVRAGLGRRVRRFVGDLLTAPRRRGNGQIMAYVALGSAGVVSLAQVVLLVVLAPAGQARAEAAALAPTIVLVPLLARLAVAARSRIGRGSIALLLTGVALLNIPVTSVYLLIGFAEWLAVLWFRPVAVEALHPQDGGDSDGTTA
jgi:hypothetical protein